MSYSEEPRRGEELLAAILSEESFRPFEPNNLHDTGLPESMVESLLVKRLNLVGMATGRKLADAICLPFNIVGQVLNTLRERRIVVHKSSAPLNDYSYALTEQGREQARIYASSCSYVGPAPVPLLDYVLSAEAQTIRAESPRRQQLQAAFNDITVDTRLFEVSVRRLIRVPACSFMENRETESRRWRSGSRCASASKSGFLRRFMKTVRLSSCTTQLFTSWPMRANFRSSSRPLMIDAG